MLIFVENSKKIMIDTKKTTFEAFVSVFIEISIVHNSLGLHTEQRYQV